MKQNIDVELARYSISELEQGLVRLLDRHADAWRAGHYDYADALMIAAKDCQLALMFRYHDRIESEQNMSSISTAAAKNTQQSPPAA